VSEDLTLSLTLTPRKKDPALHLFPKANIDVLCLFHWQLPRLTPLPALFLLFLSTSLLFSPSHLSHSTLVLHCVHHRAWGIGYRRFLEPKSFFIFFYGLGWAVLLSFRLFPAASCAFSLVSSTFLLLRSEMNTFVVLIIVQSQINWSF
jgi:hypothetical protein